MPGRIVWAVVELVVVVAVAAVVAVVSSEGRYGNQRYGWFVASMMLWWSMWRSVRGWMLGCRWSWRC